MEIKSIETFKQYAANGRYIRRATRVRFQDGSVVSFSELLPKKYAIDQAVSARTKHPEYFS